MSSSSRRSFVLHSCQALSLVTVGALLDACAKNPMSASSAPELPRVAASVSGGVATIDIASSAALSAASGAALVSAGSTSLLVARTAADAFTAVTSVCTHEGCTITGYENSIYTCPCHGSEFTTSGAVRVGPASQPLRQFATSFDGSTLRITLA